MDEKKVPFSVNNDKGPEIFTNFIFKVKSYNAYFSGPEN